MPTRLVGHALMLKGYRYFEARDPHWIKYRVLFKRQHHFLARTDDFMLCTPALKSLGTAPWVPVLAVAREAALIDWHQRHVRVLSALSSGCPVCGAFVAAILTMISFLAWAVNSSSFASEMSMHVLPRKSYIELRT